MIEQRICASDTGLPNETVKMSRMDMQTEALIIESLLNAVIAMAGDTDREFTIAIVEMAHERARGLNEALDSTHAPEAML